MSIEASEYLYRRLLDINESEEYHLSDMLLRHIYSLSSDKYVDATRGHMDGFFELLADADIVDTGYEIGGCAIWLPTGVKYKKHFVDFMSKGLQDINYDEYLFPNLISASNFKTLCDDIYNFDKQVLKVSAQGVEAVLKPTGEAVIYPTVARWLRSGKALPLRIFQSGPYFRYKSSPNVYLTPIECSFMLEAHGIFSTKDEMMNEYQSAMAVCENWMKSMCLAPLVLSRPIAFNKPVSVKTIGYDVILPNGKTIQVGMVYVQSQIFSRPYNVRYGNEKNSIITEQITFGITERSVYTLLFSHMDRVGLRLPSAMAPEKVWIMCREADDKVLFLANKIERELNSLGIASVVKYDVEREDFFAEPLIKGVPVQVFIDRSIMEKGQVEVFDRRFMCIKNINLGSSSIVNAIKISLIEGDELLEKEQISKRERLIKTLHGNNTTEGCATSFDTGEIVKVFAHNKKLCIQKIQSIGLGGEYIGEDQSGDGSVYGFCCGCGEECNTFGYISRRL